MPAERCEWCQPNPFGHVWCESTIRSPVCASRTTKGPWSPLALRLALERSSLSLEGIGPHIFSGTALVLGVKLLRAYSVRRKHTCFACEHCIKRTERFFFLDVDRRLCCKINDIRASSCCCWGSSQIFVGRPRCKKMVSSLDDLQLMISFT